MKCKDCRYYYLERCWRYTDKPFVNSYWGCDAFAERNPLISVVIPTIPSKKQSLNRALKTVENQTYGNIETIVVDEGKSAPVQRNIGIDRSRGKYIAFLDDDDEWSQNKIEKQLRFMERNPVYPLTVCYSEDRRRRKRINRPPEVSTHDSILDALNLSSTSSYLVRRDDLLCAGKYFDESLPSAQEYDLAVRLSNLAPVYCVPEVLMYQNKTKGQISEDWFKKIKGILYVFKKYRKEHKATDYLNVLGIIIVFSLGFVFGDRIYDIIDCFRR